MIIPIRCMTCGKVLADKWEYYKRETEALKKEAMTASKTEDRADTSTTKYFTQPFTKDILDKLGLERYCCRRHMLGHVDIIDNL